MQYMFYKATSFNQDLSGWTVVEHYDGANSSLKSIFYDSNLSQSNYCKIYNSQTWDYNRNLNNLGILKYITKCQ